MKNPRLGEIFEAAVENATYGIIVFAYDGGSCLFINPVAREMLGFANPKLNDLVPHEAKPPFKSFVPGLLSQPGLHHDVVLNTASSSPLIAYVGIRELRVDEQGVYLLMLQDVTVQKKLQREILAKQNEVKSAYEELIKQNRALRDLDGAKDRFIALTTHELRTPLAAMIAAAEILKLELYDTPEQMQEFITMVYDQGLHLQALVNDILDLSKIQAGKMDIEASLQPLGPIVKNVVQGFFSMAESSGVELKLDWDGGPFECHFDEMRMRQVLNNVINNALKFNQPGGFVRIYFVDVGQIVRVCVEDSGPGIAKDKFEKVFNEFETIGHVSQHHKGTGLGMPISRRLMEAMGGRLGLNSVVGVGSTFWMELPKIGPHVAKAG